MSSLPPLPPSPSSSSSIKLCIHSEFPKVSFQAKEISELSQYCAVQLDGVKHVDKDRKPLDLVLVLDKSGSMSGSKLRLCKETVEFISRELSSTDRFSIVTYDTNVDETLPLLKMDSKGKKQVKNALKKVNAGSCTNLSGGLLKGIEIMKTGLQESKADVKAVMLLTDGLMNRGITKKNDLLAVVQNALNDVPGTSLFTFGFGADHDAELLTELSETGSGVYYFIEKTDDIPNAFSDCLGGLLSVVAQNIVLHITPSGRSTIVNKPETPYKCNLLQDKVTYCIDIPDMYSEESRSILVYIRLPLLDNPVAKLPVLKATVDYCNILSQKMEKIEFELHVSRHDGPTDLTHSNEIISRQLARVKVAKVLDDVKKLADAGKIAAARTCSMDCITTLKKNHTNWSKDIYLNQLVEDISEVHQGLQTTMSWVKHGKKKCSSKAQGHKYQRCNEVGDDQSYSCYRTSAKRGMVRKSKIPN